MEAAKAKGNPRPCFSGGTSAHGMKMALVRAESKVPVHPSRPWKTVCGADAAGLFQLHRRLQDYPFWVLCCCTPPIHAHPLAFGAGLRQDRTQPRPCLDEFSCLPFSTCWPTARGSTGTMTARISESGSRGSDGRREAVKEVEQL